MNKTVLVFLIFFFFFFSAALACKNGEPNCDRIDCGTCVNACCKMKFYFDADRFSTGGLLKDILHKLSNGGPDGRYAMMTTAEGHFGYENITSFDAPQQFFGQVWHSTEKYSYHDTINWAIDRESDKKIVLEMFSISQIAGALCDYGQNYYNIITIVNSLVGSNTCKAETVWGCPKPDML